MVAGRLHVPPDTAPETLAGWRGRYDGVRLPNVALKDELARLVPDRLLGCSGHALHREALNRRASERPHLLALLTRQLVSLGGHLADQRRDLVDDRLGQLLRIVGG